MRLKLSPEQEAFIQSHYQRFGDPEARRRAYERRQAREPLYQKYGIRNLNEANSQQVAALTRRGLIGDSGYDAAVSGPAVPTVPNQGGPFGQGSGKVPPGMTPPVPGVSPTPGRPVAAMMGGSPLAAAMAAPAALNFAIRPPKRGVRQFG